MKITKKKKKNGLVGSLCFWGLFIYSDVIRVCLGDYLVEICDKRK